MDFLKKITRVKNNRITIEMPDSFNSKDVEVIVLPLDNSELRMETLALMKLSESSFNEWDNEEDEVYNDL